MTTEKELFTIKPYSNMYILYAKKVLSEKELSKLLMENNNFTSIEIADSTIVKEGMSREIVFLIDESNAGFRRNIPAEIIGIAMCTPTGLPPRLCYHLKWSDGVQDWKPVDEVAYKIVTFTELCNNISDLEAKRIKNFNELYK